MEGQEYYQLLGLPEGASMQEIKTAYRRLALKYHPDKNVSKKDNEKFKAIIEAYNNLRTVYHSGSYQSNVYNKVCKETPVSNMTSWKFLYPAKFFRELFYWSRYAEKAYHGFLKYEQDSWDCCEEMLLRTKSVISRVSSGCSQVQLRHVLCGRNPILKRALQNVRAKFNL